MCQHREMLKLMSPDLLIKESRRINRLSGRERLTGHHIMTRDKKLNYLYSEATL